MKRDIRGVRYAESKDIKYVYVDTDTGEIMQFGFGSSKISFHRKCDGMFPNRVCKTYTMKEYLNATE